MDFQDAFFLGGDIEYLRNIEYLKSEIVKQRKKMRGLPLLDTLRRLLMIMIENEIDGDVQETVTEWITKFEREYKAGDKVREADARALSKDAENLEPMVIRELDKRRIIELTSKGTLNQEALISISKGKPSAIFDKEIWRKLPPIAKSDLSEAAKCLLIEASTPATMVALRGMEAVVRDYYSSKRGRSCGRKSLGAVINELMNLPDANAKLLSYIDYLRSEKRNFAQHPDKTFTQEEAERIFMEIINVVYEIYTHTQV